MPTNDFLPFAAAGGANVLAQADYLALAARLAGFVDGVAMPEEANKAWRQSSLAAAMLGQFIVNRAGLDALDDGSVTNLLAAFEAAYRKQATNYVSAVGGTANALSITLDPAPAAWSDLTGMPLNLLLAATNTGAATLAVTGLSGTKSILRPGGAALVAGDLGSGSVARLIYDGTAFQMAGLTQASARQTIIYSTPGTYTWVCPAGVFSVRAMVWAGGGGGGGAASAANSIASAAGGGEYREGQFAVTPGTSYSVVVGAGGTGGLGVGPTNGGAGGTSSFGAFVSAIGGTGGTAANGAIQASSGAGGSGGSGGTIARSGIGGGIGYAIGSGFVMSQGGSAFTSNYTITKTTASAAQGADGNFPGGGAQGGALFANGGTGAGGQVILEY